MNSVIEKLLEIADNNKQNITDGDYMEIMKNLTQLNKIKNEKEDYDREDTIYRLFKKGEDIMSFEKKGNYFYEKENVIDRIAHEIYVFHNNYEKEYKAFFYDEEEQEHIEINELRDEECITIQVRDLIKDNDEAIFFLYNKNVEKEDILNDIYGQEDIYIKYQVCEMCD